MEDRQDAYRSWVAVRGKLAAILFIFSTSVYFPYQEEKMYRTTRSPMMQPLVNSGMGMAPFFKVNVSLDYTKTHQMVLLSVHLWLTASAIFSDLHR